MSAANSGVGPGPITSASAAASPPAASSPAGPASPSTRRPPPPQPPGVPRLVDHLPGGDQGQQPPELVAVAQLRVLPLGGPLEDTVQRAEGDVFLVRLRAGVGEPA